VPTTPASQLNRPIVAYAGHLYAWKGVDILLEALASLPDVDGLIVGGHEREPDLARTRAVAERVGVASRVTFTGLVEPPQVRDLLARASVLVLPNPASAVSSRFTSPLKLFEYMAAGRPIVASDLPALREVLSPDENAVLVTPGSAPALAAGIRQVIDDPALASRLALHALETVADFSWDRRAERLDALLTAVLAR
jgi:glycosyltransferase involved in cell wall biosynthesis